MIESLQTLETVKKDYTQKRFLVYIVLNFSRSFCFQRYQYIVCQCLWIVHFWLPFLFYLTFI